MRKLMLGVALLALLLAGCRIETNITVALEADGSGDLIIDIGLDDEALQLIESGGDLSFADGCTADGGGVTDLLGGNPLEGVVDDLQQDAEVSLVTEGDLTVCRARIAFDDVESIAGSGVDDGLSFDVSVTDDEVRVDASLDAGAAGGETDGLSDLGLDPSVLEDVFAFHLRVMMPGEVVEHNADRVLADGSLEWDVDVFGGGGVTVAAVSDPAGGGGGLPVGVIVVIVAVVAVAAFLWARSRSGKPAAAGPEEALGEAPPPAPPAPEPPAEDPQA